MHESMEVDGDWACVQCTLTNSVQTDICQACGKPQNSKAVDRSKGAIPKTKVKRSKPLTTRPSPLGGPGSSSQEPVIVDSEEAEDDVWKCGNCNMKNSAKVENCISCNENKFKEVIMINDDDEYVVKYNHTSKPITDDKGGTDGAGQSKDKTKNGIGHKSEECWKCQRCTFNNPMKSKNCEICHSPREIKLPTLDTVSEFEARKVEYPTTSKRGEPDGMESDMETGGATANPPVASKPSPSVNPLPRKKQHHPRAKSDPVFIEDGKEWTCSACSFACNPSWSPKCTKCQKGDIPGGVPRASPKMITPEGKFPAINQHSPLRKVHSSPRQSPDSGKMEKKDKGFWICNRCTFHNPAVERMCKMCGGRRSTSELDMRNYWSCDKCTLHNPIENSSCAACGFKRSITNSILFPNTKATPVSETDVSKTPEPSDRKEVGRKDGGSAKSSNSEVSKGKGKESDESNKVQGRKAEKSAKSTQEEKTSKSSLEKNKDQGQKPSTEKNIDKTPKSSLEKKKDKTSKLSLEKVKDKTPRSSLEKNKDKTPKSSLEKNKEKEKGKNKSLEKEKNKSLEKDNLWSCTQCTYKNPLKMADCQMCGSSKSHRKHFDPNLITLARQPSSLMEDIRKIEENEALELWQHITLFCRQVS